jgi:Arc/MetJ family transcription regulator
VKISIQIDEELLARAAKLTGMEEKSKLVKLGLEALIARESSDRLAKLGGAEKNLKKIPRRRAIKAPNRRRQLEITKLFGKMEPDADYDYKKGRSGGKCLWLHPSERMRRVQRIKFKLILFC